MKQLHGTKEFEDRSLRISTMPSDTIFTAPVIRAPAESLTPVQLTMTRNGMQQNTASEHFTNTTSVGAWLRRHTLTRPSLHRMMKSVPSCILERDIVMKQHSISRPHGAITIERSNAILNAGNSGCVAG